MSNKTKAIVAYITIIGWIIAYLDYKKSTDKSPLVNYHLGQSLGLIILSFVLGIVVTILVSIVPSLYFLSMIVSLVSLVLLLLGIITANNETIKPLPIVGKLFEGKFNFAS
ncbi:DUF4870 domain-containing protein [Mucilaginibacter roseus]|uniref:DUF4870 domain-containing protein n=1 Tax=Mucilaginibacter roseus TaxID=1528868 RepID=A0ABS8TYV4_9SPHI|nr:DUF4870 domain-containing protein [Mucilaginibacter roseus]MCD8739152.1 DUF4870 domain-containing protein [Mucilaginibacter roseus]